MDPSDICFLVTYNNDYKKITEISVDKNIRKYCKLHGYTLWVHQHDSDYDSRTAHWEKIKVCLKLLNTEKFNWIFFMDADCLLMNTTIKLETFIDENFSFIIPSHLMNPPDTPIKNSQGTNMVITSQFFVKNNSIGKEILEDIWDAPDWPKDLSINTFDHEGRQTRVTIDKEKFKPHVKVIKEELVNKFWYMNNPFMALRNIGINENVWHPGDFIVHVTGYPLDVRKKLLSDLIYFSGGLTSGFKEFTDHISFIATESAKNITIILYNLQEEPLYNFFFDELNVKSEYYLYKPNNFIYVDLIIKTYDENSNLVGLYLLEK
jgi:hypothetical protein